MRKIFRRRIYLVDRSLQVRLILYSIGYIGFYISALGAALFAPLVFGLDGADLNSQEAQDMARSFLYLHDHFWPLALLAVAAVALHSLVATHRIAGPLYRFRQILAEIRDGRIPPPARIRRNDLLQAEMRLINEMLDSLRARLSERQEAQAALLETISDWQAGIGAEAGREVTGRLQELAVRGDSLVKVSQTIRVEE